MPLSIKYFGSTSCTQCRAIKEELKGIDYTDHTDDDQAFEKYDISVLPTLIIEQDGKEVKRISGFHTAEQIREWLK